MRGLTPPPKQETPSRVLGRVLFLLILAALAGVVIYSTVTIQRIPLVEDFRAAALELDSTVEVDGLTVNLVEGEGNGEPVVIIHDIDPAGGLNLDDLAAHLDGSYFPVRVDLPGFGYSDRVPVASELHTAAGMAEVVAAVIDERFDRAVLVVGVGFGGEVAADVALANPDLVAGLVLVDADFWSRASGIASLERLPWAGRAATYTWETGGRFALGGWSPHCAEGGWCPTPDEIANRAFIVSIEGTTQSLYEFLRTPEAASAPARLDEIQAPIAYVWSRAGDVSQQTVDRMVDEIPGLHVVESAAFSTHLEDPAAIAEALGMLAG